MLRFSRRTSSSAHAAGDRRGFAMFLAIGALVIIGVLVAGSSFVSLQEQRLGQNSLVQTKAFSVAEYGLNKIQQDWDRTPNLQMANGARFDTSYTLTGQGTARVHYTRLNNETFWIVSEGRSNVGTGTGAGRTAVKRVGAVLRLRIPTVRVRGAITAGGNVNVRGGANVTGRDSVPPNWGSDCSGIPEQDLAGVVVPIGASVTTQGGSTVDGVPPTVQDPLAADQNTYIRYGDETWNTLTQQASPRFEGSTTVGQIAPDSLLNGTCNKGNLTNWGEPFRGPLTVAPCYNYFPIIYVNGNLTINNISRGQGILLVNGSITINGNFTWHGLVIVANDIVRGNGSATIFGGVMARNEVKADESMITGNTIYAYSSCALERAMRGSAQVVQAKERAWTELY
jgi:hypothetical protein